MLAHAFARSPLRAPALLGLVALAALAVVAPACGGVDGASGEASNTPADELYDPPTASELPPDFDDGLAAILDDPSIDAPAAPTASATTTPSTTPSTTPTTTPTTTPPAPKTPHCDADAKSGDYCGGDKVSNGSVATLYHCTGPNVAASVVKVCTAGCFVAPAGSDDVCKTPPAPTPSTPTSPQAEACPHVAAILKWGLHPIASDRLRCVGISAARISQTIGNATASAGTHAQDGVFAGHAYSAATDLSVSGLSDAQVKTLITKLDQMGFAAFFRNPGHDGWPSSEARHVHAVFAGAAMKSSLRAQISDFLAGKNGLATHTAYTFYQPPASVKAYTKWIFDAAN
jgi:hypothetical protein